MWLASYTVNFTMPSFHMVVCAGTINFAIVLNVDRIRPIESGLFSLCDGFPEPQLLIPSMLLPRTFRDKKDRATIVETKALNVESSRYVVCNPNFCSFVKIDCE